MNSLKELLNSKKFRTAALSAILMILNRVTGLNIDIEYMVVTISPFIAYILGQGIADSKKG